MHVLSNSVATLQRLLGMPVILYVTTPGPFKPIEEADVEPVHTCLSHTLGKDRQVALVLHTAGGYVNAARHLAVMLREHVEHLSIVVPHRAISAGTLLCLSADQLMLGQLAELSPLDPNVSSAHPQAGMPPSISSADIHAYIEMAEAWFGLNREQHGLELFKLLNQKFFPTSLSSFYRSEQQMLTYCRELLIYSMSSATSADRETVADKLVRGYGSHDCIITRPEVIELGLNTRCLSPEEDQAAFDLIRACQTLKKDETQTMNCVVASEVFLSTHEAVTPVGYRPPLEHTEIEVDTDLPEQTLTWRVHT